MTHWLDEGLVGVLLLASAVYAAMSLGPRGVRRRVLRIAGACLGRFPRSFGLRGWAARCTAAAVRAQGSCGGCDSCASEAPASGPASSPAQGTARDIRIAPSQIGRRSDPSRRGDSSRINYP